METKSTALSEMLSLVRYIAAAVIIALFVNSFIFVNAQVPSGSMENTVMTGDRLFGLRFAYAKSEPQRGDIVIFEYPIAKALGRKVYYIKRIIGLPGEHVEIREGKIYIDGSEKPLEEKYLKDEWVNRNDGYSFDIPEGSYLMLGDNRNASGDARIWREEAEKQFAKAGKEFSAEEAEAMTYVSREDILGKAWLIYWPLSNAGIIE